MTKKIIKFKTTKWNTSIEQIEAEKETSKCIWINSDKRAKESQYDNYWNTWDEAYIYLLNRSTDKLSAARLNLQKAQGEYGNIKGMKNKTELKL